MKKELIISIILVIVAIVFVGFFILGDILNTKFFQEKDSIKQELQNENLDEVSLEENKQKCVELGCEQGSIYIGSINSDKYYECSCHYADRIHLENIVCFKTKDEAELDNRIFIEC